jgi:uncharacterized protein YuzE
MRLTYYPSRNLAYLRFKEKGAQVEAIHVSDELIVDMAPDGTVYGIELLNANEQIQCEGTGKIVVINEATGQRTELPLLVSGK